MWRARKRRSCQTELPQSGAVAGAQWRSTKASVTASASVRLTCERRTRSTNPDAAW